MNYLKQVITVTRWEFTRFFKPKNEILGIIVMVVVSVISYGVTRLALAEPGEKMEIAVLSGTEPSLIEFLGTNYIVKEVPNDEKQAFIGQINTNREGVLVELQPEGGFALHAYKNTRDIRNFKAFLTEYHKLREMEKIGLSPDELSVVLSPAPVIENFAYTDNSAKRVVLSYFFAGLMLMAVFLGFAYQFTAITGEKQLKITEQIVSAISPQVWMDGKIFGITLTGISSIITYAVVSIVGGMLIFQFIGLPATGIFDYINLPSIIIYLPFALVGILIWNAILATIASIITDPNNSAKSSLMMLPIVFVIASFLITRNPDSNFSVFLSWFPLTSATAMPMRWAITEVEFWQLAGSFVLLLLTFYFLRKLAAKIFRVSILITGKEPSFSEVYKLSKQA